MRDGTDRPIEIASRSARTRCRTSSPREADPQARRRDPDARIDQDLLAPLLDGKEDELAKIIPELSNAVGDAGKGVTQLQALLDPKRPRIRRSSGPTSSWTTPTRPSVELKNRAHDGRPAGPLNAALTEGEGRPRRPARRRIDDAAAVSIDAKPKVKELLDNLRTRAARLDARLTEVQKKLDEAARRRGPPRDAPSRPNSPTSWSRSSNAAWEIELAARKVRANPAVLIFGDDENQRLEADPRDDTRPAKERAREALRAARRIADEEGLTQSLSRTPFPASVARGARRPWSRAARATYTPVRTHFNKGVRLYDEENYSGAGREYRLAIEEDPMDHRAHFNLAMTLEEQGRTDLARAEYEWILSVRPDDLRAVGEPRRDRNRGRGARGRLRAPPGRRRPATPRSRCRASRSPRTTSAKTGSTRPRGSCARP